MKRQLNYEEARAIAIEKARRAYDNATNEDSELNDFDELTIYSEFGPEHIEPEPERIKPILETTTIPMYMWFLVFFSGFVILDFVWNIFKALF